MTAVLITIHVLSAILLVLSILLQPGRSSGFSLTFSETATAIFGGRGALSFLEKFTAGAATLFVITSLFLAMRFGHGGGGTVMKEVPAPEAEVGPAETAPPLPPATESAPSPAPTPAPSGAPREAAPPSTVPLPPPQETKTP
ncbi:MAG: preprotein translocase subunit SecG [Nitrospirae bacterium]|nr:preprotein translocase subunit SecG [Nitrospirota bacterium]